MVKLKKEKGITMVALVVTILVLLVLAGVGINAITNDNGIIKSAEESKKQTEIADLKEQIQNAIIQAEAENYNTTIDDVIQKLIDKGIIADASSVNKATGAITTKSPTYVIEGMLDDYITNTISFVFSNVSLENDITYKADRGMTWGEFCESSYNDDRFRVIDDGSVMVLKEFLRYDSEIVKSADVIVDGATYYSNDGYS